MTTKLYTRDYIAARKTSLYTPLRIPFNVT